MHYLIIVLVGCAIIFLAYYESNKKPPIEPVAKKYCFHCGTQIDKSATICPTCGKSLNKPDGDDIPKKFCLYCGAEIPKTATICSICRRNLSPPPPSAPPQLYETLDELFAKENNMWVCEWCETLNPNSSSVCAACGKRKCEESR